MIHSFFTHQFSPLDGVVNKRDVLLSVTQKKARAKDRQCRRGRRGLRSKMMIMDLTAKLCKKYYGKLGQAAWWSNARDPWQYVTSMWFVRIFLATPMIRGEACKNLCAPRP